MLDMVNVGFGHYVQLKKISSILPYGAMASKALLKYKAKGEDFTVFKCTKGRKARSLVLMDNGGVFVSPLDVEDILKNILKSKEGVIDG